MGCSAEYDQPQETVCVTKLARRSCLHQRYPKELLKEKDLYAFYLRQWCGVDPTDGSGLYYRNPGLANGTDVRIGKGGDSLTTNPTNAFYAYSGSAIPKIFGSFTNTVSYKGVSLHSGSTINCGKFYDGSYAGYMGLSYGKSPHADALKAWQKPRL